MSHKEFTLYVVSKDKQSLDFIHYFYENMKDIKMRGFPKPQIISMNKKQVFKSKELLMNRGIRVLPCIKFNGNVYSKDELYSLVKTDLHKLKKKSKPKEKLNDYYQSASDDYFAMMGMKHHAMGSKSADVRPGYQSDEEPLTEAGLKEMMANQEKAGRRPESRGKQEEIRGSTTQDSDSELSEVSEEEPTPKKSDKKKGGKKYENDDDIDSYYANLALAGEGLSD